MTPQAWTRSGDCLAPDRDRYAACRRALPDRHGPARRRRAHARDLRLRRGQGPGAGPRRRRVHAHRAAAITATPGSRFPPPGPNLALSSDGSRLLLGSINRNCRTPSPAERYCGVAELFERRDGAWQRTATLLPPPDQDGLTRFGQSVALSPDGTLALAGGTGEAGGAGMLWVYAMDGPEPQPIQALRPARAAAGLRQCAELVRRRLVAGGGRRPVGASVRARGQWLRLAQDPHPARPVSGLFR